MLLVLALSGQARADDATNLELWKQQAKINQLMQQRITALEKRVALVEQKVPTGYVPGTPPPAVVPSYTPPPATYAAPTTFVPLPGSPLSPAEQETLQGYFVRVGTNGGDPRMSPAEQEGWNKLIRLLGK